MKLNLGCGGDVRPGYENLDLYSEVPGVKRADVSGPLPVEDGSVDEIVAQDVLEHISHRRWKEVLADWVSKLKPGGTIIIRLPNPDSQINLLRSGVWGPRTFAHMLFGGQEFPGNYHCNCIFEAELCDELTMLGCQVIHCYNVPGNFVDGPQSDNANYEICALKR